MRGSLFAIGDSAVPMARLYEGDAQRFLSYVPLRTILTLEVIWREG